MCHGCSKRMGNLRGEMARAFGLGWMIASGLMILPFFLENTLLIPLMFTEQVDAVSAMINYLYKGAMMPLSLLCVAIPYAASILADVKNRSLKYQLHRCGTGRFARDRFVANALAGASAIGFAQLVLFLLLCIVYPYPDIGYRFLPTGNAWESLFYERAGLYVLVIIGLHFVANMAWSSLAMAASLYVKNSYVTLFVPLILVNALSAIATTGVWDKIRSIVYLVHDIDFWREGAAIKLAEYSGFFLGMMAISYLLVRLGIRKNAAGI